MYKINRKPMEHDSIKRAFRYWSKATGNDSKLIVKVTEADDKTIIEVRELLNMTYIVNVYEYKEGGFKQVVCCDIPEVKAYDSLTEALKNARSLRLKLRVV